MIEIKQSTSAFVSVRLMSAAGPVSSVTVGSISVSVGKSDGTWTNLSSLLSSDWKELGADDVGSALNATGVYMLKLPASSTNLTGSLVYAVKTTGADTFVGSIKVVANEEADTFAIIGNPLEIHTSGIYANHMTVYESDGTTPRYRFALFNRGGQPTTTDIFKRVRVL